MATQYSQQHPRAHPHLFEPILYISQIPSYVSDETLAQVFIGCGPFRPKINRNTPDPLLSGTIEFKFLEKAEQALATLQSKPIPNVSPPTPVILSPFPPTEPPTPFPRPGAAPRLVKHLPPGFTDMKLYDLFRPYGPLASAHAQTHFGVDTGMVEFWSEDDAREAETALHCADIEGSNIAVQIYQPRKASNMADFASAPSFVPSGSGVSPPQQYSPTRAMFNRSPPVFVHGPGQQVQLAPLSGPGSGSHSGLIDPCNLFCKNLDPEIDSKSLFNHFKQFGQIVSARVMRNELGDSRGFGFVSFQTPEQASAAMHGMNGIVLGSKQLVVRLHEPKQLRQEKLAQRFGHPRNSSGATSPTASEFGGDTMGWQSPRLASTSNLGSPVANYDRQDRGRRGSSSYYSAALAGTLNMSMRYEDLSALTPNLRREVLQGELSRRVKSMGTVSNEELDSVVEQLISMSLSEVVDAIHNPDKLTEHVQVLTSPSPPNDSRERSRSASQDSRLLDPAALNATASAPEHPSTPISVNATLSTPPRTSSPSGSVPPTSEKDRMLLAVSKLEPAKREELTELLMSLPKRERAMCLFNVEILRAKLVDAKAILDSEDEEEAVEEPKTAIPVTPKKASKTRPESAPQTPDLSSRGPSAAASPLPTTPSITSTTTTSAPSTSGPTHSMASLAKLPAAEIVRLVNLSTTTGLPIPKPDPMVAKATDEFIDGILGDSVQMQKQKLGDKLFKVVKAFGIKGAPKITIALLDSEDLRALAHLMNSYPAVLKEKVLLAQAQPSK